MGCAIFTGSPSANSVRDLALPRGSTVMGHYLQIGSTADCTLMLANAVALVVSG